MPHISYDLYPELYFETSMLEKTVLTYHAYVVAVEQNSRQLGLAARVVTIGRRKSGKVTKRANKQFLFKHTTL